MTIAVANDRVVLRGPRSCDDLARQLLADGSALAELLQVEEAEIAWRQEQFRSQIPPVGPIPLLLTSRASDVPGFCLSCDRRLSSADRYRCSLCTIAAQRALGFVREDATNDQP